MDTAPLAAEDETLIETITGTNDRTFDPEFFGGSHIVTAGVRTCVAVSHPMPSHDASEIAVVPPCGVCREMLADYNEEMRVVVPVADRLRVATAIDLLPARTW